MAALAIPQPASYNSDPDYDLKLRFAAAYLRLNDSMKAIMVVVADPGKALQVVDRWLMDPVVIDEMERLVDEKGGASAFLPTKESMLVDLKTRMDTCKDNTEYKSLFELYSKVRGWIEKPGQNSGVNLTIAPVMVVPMGSSSAEWERNSASSQRRLIDASRD